MDHAAHSQPAILRLAVSRHGRGSLRSNRFPRYLERQTLLCAGQDRVGPKSNVRFGSKADICSALDYVRFTPNSDIDCIFQCVCFGPKAEMVTYSITSSARCRNASETFSPSARAVL